MFLLLALHTPHPTLPPLTRDAGTELVRGLGSTISQTLVSSRCQELLGLESEWEQQGLRLGDSSTESAPMLNKKT
jgi:hypothetical protein